MSTIQHHNGVSEPRLECDCVACGRDGEYADLRAEYNHEFPRVTHLGGRRLSTHIRSFVRPRNLIRHFLQWKHRPWMGQGRSEGLVVPWHGGFYNTHIRRPSPEYDGRSIGVQHWWPTHKGGVWGWGGGPQRVGFATQVSGGGLSARGKQIPFSKGSPRDWSARSRYQKRSIG